uniref:Transmembrane protein n=1 Tax=Ascaris lumbricoides TaxID=6252 RepID=A0A0M3IIH3_ASCLU
MAFGIRIIRSQLLTIFVMLQMVNADVIDDIKEIRIFELKKSSLACPIIVVGEQCPEETPLYYFKCCGDLNGSCCFRLQEWVVVLLVIMGVLIAISFVVNFIRCLFCYGR